MFLLPSLNHYCPKAFTILLATILLPQIGFSSIDLTPRYTDMFADGIVLHRLYFTDGQKKFVVSLNRETEVSADAGGVLFRFPKFPEITFSMARSRLSPDDKFEGATLERYRESAKRLLPVLARSSVILEEALNPLPVNGWKSFRVVLTCEVGATHYFQSVTFLNLNETDQIVLVTGSPEKDFNEATVRSFQIIRTWQPMLPGDEKVLQGN